MPGTATAALAQLAADTVAAHPCGPSGAGDPIRRVSRIIGGHHVVAKVIGWGDDLEPIFEVDRSTEPLALTAAAERVGA